MKTTLRSRVLRSLALCLLVSAGTACGNSTLSAIEKAKDDICACPDKACAKKIRSANKELEKKAMELPNVEKAQALKFVTEAEACVKKLKK